MMKFSTNMQLFLNSYTTISTYCCITVLSLRDLRYGFSGDDQKMSRSLRSHIMEGYALENRENTKDCDECITRLLTRRILKHLQERRTELFLGFSNRYSAD